MHEYSKRNKICLIVIVISLFLFLITKFQTGFTEKNRLEKKLKNLGNLYYQSVFYPSLADRDTNFEFLESFSDKGYRVNLLNLISSTDVEEEIFILNDKKCNLQKSYVLLYPKFPFKQDDVKVKAFLNCTE